MKGYVGIGVHPCLSPDLRDFDWQFHPMVFSATSFSLGRLQSLRGGSIAEFLSGRILVGKDIRFRHRTFRFFHRERLKAGKQRIV